MLITLNNGKTIEITSETFFAMNDEQFKFFMEGESGEEINNPFFQSQIDKRDHKDDYYED